MYIQKENSKFQVSLLPNIFDGLSSFSNGLISMMIQTIYANFKRFSMEYEDFIA